MVYKNSLLQIHLAQFLISFDGKQINLFHSIFYLCQPASALDRYCILFSYIYIFLLLYNIFNNPCFPSFILQSFIKYYPKSRDSTARTLFQCNNTISRGFLRQRGNVASGARYNYTTLNSAAQKTASVSHYKVFKSVPRVERKLVIERGCLRTVLITEKILGMTRRHGASVVTPMINFADEPVTAVDARTWMNIPEQLIVYASSVHSELLAGSYVDATRISVPGSTSVASCSLRQIWFSK